MSSPSDDEDLKQAIAISLERSPPGVTIDLTSDNEDEIAISSPSDDEDVKLAIALSLQRSSPGGTIDLTSDKEDEQSLDTANPVTKPPNESAQFAPPVTAAPTATSGRSGSMGLDRKAMEQERLARLGKRKRELSPERPSKQIAQKPFTQGVTSSSLPTRSPEGTVLQYPRGAIKRTSASKFPRSNDISVDEVLQADSVNIAVISSFMWDVDWLYKKLNPMKVKQIWVMNAKGQDTQERWVQEMKDSQVPNLKLHFPPMHGMIHCMHSKFMLLFGKDKLRFVVTTANMTQIDWGEVANDWQPGVMENSVFLIDLPRRADGEVKSKSELSRFGQELVYFLEQQEIGKNVVEGVLKFDFSQTSHLAFVHSIGGAHKAESEQSTGLAGLAQAIRDLKLDEVQDMELDYAASSIGAVNDTFLQRLYLAACGESFTTDSRATKVRDRIRIYFPTQETVEKSIGGADCGGIISLARQHYMAPTFPRECLRNYASTRRGMLSHNKLLFARGRRRDGRAVAWVYVGSANLSESAWGGQRVVKGGKMGSLNIRNWECGVVVPVEADVLGREEGGSVPMRVFEGTVEVPFCYGGEEYGGQQPWCQA